VSAKHPAPVELEFEKVGRKHWQKPGNTERLRKDFGMSKKSNPKIIKHPFWCFI